MSFRVWSTKTVPHRMSMNCQDPYMGIYRCGKCRGCKKLKSWHWAQRCRLEALSHERTWLMSLTYEGKKEPEYVDVQKFIKRLRKRGRVHKYFVCTEYGSLNRRKHYHLLVYCTRSIGRRDVEETWSIGFKFAKLATSARLLRYAAKYITKGGRYRFSQNLGVAICEEINATEEWQAVKAAFPGSSIYSIDGVKLPGPILKKLYPREPQRDWMEPWIHHEFLRRKAELKMTRKKRPTKRSTPMVAEDINETA